MNNGERKERRGFASMSPEKQREIASKGGRAAHQKGTAHEWTSDEAAEKDLADLPGLLDHVDALLAEGVLGGAEPNAADYQVATSVRLLLCFDDLRDAIEKRPCAAYARAVVKDFPGHIPAVLPDAWLAGFR